MILHIIRPSALPLFLFLPTDHNFVQIHDSKHSQTIWRLEMEITVYSSYSYRV